MQNNKQHKTDGNVTLAKPFLVSSVMKRRRMQFLLPFFWLRSSSVLVAAFNPSKAFNGQTTTPIRDYLTTSRPWTLSLSLNSTPNGKTTSNPEITSTCPLQMRPYKHVLAILSMPYTSIDRIANEAILETAVCKTDKLSIVLRCAGARKSPSLVSLRKYVGEIYSQLWDLVIDEFPQRGVPDIVVYPQNLPNTAPESWIDIQPDLDCVCTHDSLCGWISEEATGRGLQHLNRGGRGGLKEHVAALNADRKRRKLESVVPLFPERWPVGATLETALNDQVIFLDDEADTKSAVQLAMSAPSDFEEQSDGHPSIQTTSFLSGAAIASKVLFDSVAVGGTFDGLHFGHRKLLTLAISSVQPMTGRLLIGITIDEMLQRKEHAASIAPYETRAQTVRHFLQRLAPGMLNRIKLVPITDKFGPPGQPDMFFDALVLSHEVLDTGFELNKHRASLGLDPLYLLCTRRTEAQVMSSTTMRKFKAER